MLIKIYKKEEEEGKKKNSMAFLPCVGSIIMGFQGGHLNPNPYS
jgi:hypothetical protein